MSKGKATAYPGKVQKPITTNLTQPCRTVADIYEVNVSVSRSDLLEHALRKMAGLTLNQDLEQKLSEVELPIEELNANVA